MPPYYLVFNEDTLLLIKKNERWTLPSEKDLPNKTLYSTEFSITDTEGTRYQVTEGNIVLTEMDSHFYNLREVHALLGNPLFQWIARARGLLEWHKQHIFCGHCGHATDFFDEERAKKCLRCGSVFYPKIAPCVLIAITHGDKILLAQHALRSRKNLYTVLAGFVEPGETLEECAHREVKEEVGITIKNLRYIASQAWPFPNLLMCGFTAEYANGEIQLDKTEILDARWFHKDTPPEKFPLPFTLSYQLIEGFFKK